MTAASVAIHSDRMSVEVSTTRFGTVSVTPDQLVEFPDGLIGLGGHRYALLPADGRFRWLQSLDNPALAVPVTDPCALFPGYTIELTDGDAAKLGGVGDGVQAFVTVTVRRDPLVVTANQKAPILLRDGRGFQFINQVDGMEVRAVVAGVTAGS